MYWINSHKKKNVLDKFIFMYETMSGQHINKFDDVTSFCMYNW